MSAPRSGRAALIVLCLTAVIAGGAAYLGERTRSARAIETESEQFSEYVDAEGNITLPAEYQTRFLHLGTFAVSTTSDGSTDEIHGVYVRPKDVEAYRRDGRFPDGAVLVKDVYRTTSGSLTTGPTSWATDVKVWFVMIKDTRGRFKENALWGDGWGWALFDGKDPGTQIATDYSTDCRPCHIPARKDDWLYVRGYPVLRRKSAAR